MSSSNPNISSSWMAKLSELYDKYIGSIKRSSGSNSVPLAKDHPSLQPNLELFHKFYASPQREDVRKEVIAFIDAQLSNLVKNNKSNLAKKSSAIAAQFRADGNLEYSKNWAFDRAIVAYTEAILVAPEDEQVDQLSSSNLALAYGNRSAVFFELGYWQEALEDIEHALEAGHRGVQKLLARKAQALLNLGLPVQADAVIKEIENRSPSFFQAHPRESSPLDAFEDLVAEWTSKNVQPKSPTPNQLPLSTIISALSDANRYSPSPSLPSLSSKLEVKVDPKKGRYLVAREAISPGELLSAELPYCSVLRVEQELECCHHCFRRLYVEKFDYETNDYLKKYIGKKKEQAEGCKGKPLYIKAAVPCSHCTNVLFCSSACKSEAWTCYHQFECQFLPFFHELGAVYHLALRMLFTLEGGLSTALKVVEAADKLQKMSETSENSSTSPYASVYGLSHKCEPKSLNKTYAFHSLTSGLLLELATRSGYFKKSRSCKVDGGVKAFAGALILRHLLLSSPNMTVSRSKTSSLFKAVSIYPKTAGALNHSCAPNVTSTFDLPGGRLQLLRACKPIKVGQEVLEAYDLAHHATLDMEQRQEMLLKIYNFKCQCWACWEELKTGIEGSRWHLFLACQEANCRSLILNNLPDETIYTYACTKCKEIVPFLKVQQAYNIFESIYSLIEDFSMEKSFPYIARITKLEDLYEEGSRELASMKSALISESLFVEEGLEKLMAMLAVVESGSTQTVPSRALLVLSKHYYDLSVAYGLLGEMTEEARLAERFCGLIEAVYEADPSTLTSTNKLSQNLRKLVDLTVKFVGQEIDSGKEGEELANSKWTARLDRLLIILDFFSLEGVLLPLPVGDCNNTHFSRERRSLVELKMLVDEALEG